MQILASVAIEANAFKEELFAWFLFIIRIEMSLGFEFVFSMCKGTL